MGQTLSHGVYLPNEGERNCYAGLASNWRILNTAVGAIAEKAPLVHTHTVSQITDFPAYGTTAGTICEGNDSRLSDARTPVAHTHTKSDVTDLLNSDFIPSANNSYDLGSSNYQWNNLYAKNYYYNGVAWGLDKENTWSQNQIIASGTSDKCYYVKDTVYELGQSYSSGEHLGGLTIHDKNGSVVGLIDIVDRSYGNMEMRIRVQQKFDPNSNNRSTSGNTLFNEMIIGITPTKTNYIGFNADLWGANYNLGTSTNKWKSFNGINPGALSLPDINSPDVYDVGTDINNLTKNTTDPLHFSWTSPADGWLAIMWYLKNLTPPFNVLITSHSEAVLSKFSQTWSAPSSRWFFATTFPVVKNVTYYFNIDFQNTTIGVVHHAYLLPCLGNV